MKMLDSKSDSMNNNAGDNQGYNPQGSYNQPAQNQYNNSSNSQNSQNNNYGGMNNQASKSMPEQKIPEIDIDEVKNSTRYTGGYDVRSPEVKTFWAVFEQMTMKDRAKLLKFITGTSKVPLDGFDPLFTITKGSDGSDALPRSHTCFNQIVVPPYETFELCRSKLTFAIENAVGFHLT